MTTIKDVLQKPNGTTEVLEHIAKLTIGARYTELSAFFPDLMAEVGREKPAQFDISDVVPEIVENAPALAATRLLIQMISVDAQLQPRALNDTFYALFFQHVHKTKQEAILAQVAPPTLTRSWCSTASSPTARGTRTSSSRSAGPTPSSWGSASGCSSGSSCIRR